MEYGKRLNPERSLRTRKGIKGTRQKVIFTHNPSKIDQNQLLLVRFPNLGSDDVIVPGMANLSFNIELTSTADLNRTLVSIRKQIHLDFEMSVSSAPYYQAGLRNRLCYEITFNDYNRVISSSAAAPDAKYKITDISLEYEIVTQPDLLRSTAVEYDKMALLYDRILRHRQIPVSKYDTTWNWSFNTPCKS